MGKDVDFKNNIMIKGFSKQTNRYGLEYYSPDAILKNNNIQVVCESSSTGDRKKHIGELLQFVTLVCDEKQENQDFYFVLFINTESKKGCSADKESNRLKYYFDRTSISREKLRKIKGIYVVNQHDVDITNISIEDFNQKPYYSVL